MATRSARSKMASFWASGGLLPYDAGGCPFGMLYRDGSGWATQSGRGAMAAMEQVRRRPPCIPRNSPSSVASQKIQVVRTEGSGGRGGRFAVGKQAVEVHELLGVEVVMYQPGRGRGTIVGSSRRPWATRRHSNNQTGCSVACSSAALTVRCTRSARSRLNACRNGQDADERPIRRGTCATFSRRSNSPIRSSEISLGGA